MSCYVHNLPGRLRVRIPAAKGNTALASELVHRLNAQTGVKNVQTSPVTGSFLIFYDTTATNARDCLAILNVDAPREPKRSGLGAKIAEAATWYVLEKAVERCLPLILAALL